MAMDANGSNQTVVVDGTNSRRPLHPSWSPDGRSLVFDDRIRSRETCPFALGFVSLDENNQWSSLVTLDCQGWKATEPSWSPNNLGGVNKVAYVATQFDYDDTDLFLTEFTMGPDGPIADPQQRLTDTPDIYETGPKWSSDGSEIAVKLHPIDWPETDEDLVVLDLTDMSIRSLIPPSSPLKGAFLGDIAWAKSNDFLVVASNNDLWCIDTFDGSQVTNLTETLEEQVGSPNWSPDDTEIVFSKGRSAMVMGVDTSGGSCQAVPDSIREIAKAGKQELIFDLDWRH
jgi:Tol biopolymer transport system component